jgi:hypothetical protein
MDLLRQSLRKVRTDGPRAFATTAFDELYRGALLRRVVDRRFDYDRRCVPLSRLLAEEKCVELDRIDPAIDRYPRKYRVDDAAAVTDAPRWEAEAQALCRLPNATVYPPVGLVATEAREYVVDSVASPGKVYDDVGYDWRRLSVALSMYAADHGVSTYLAAHEGCGGGLTPEARFDEAVVLMPLWANYYHWTVESLFKLHWIDRYETSTGRRPTLLLPADVSSWMLESLSLLGYDEDDVARVDSPAVRVDSLLLPSHVTPVAEHQQWVRKRALSSVSEVEMPENARIYISRENATKRRVANEDAVVDALAARGFESYALEALSVAEQVALFADAEAVVGPHGAGFANLVYAADPFVVELFGRKRLNTYQRLSELLGFDYEAQYCEMRGTDVVVDVDALGALLDDRLGE